MKRAQNLLKNTKKIIDLDDPDDPYNFTANSDVHPEPLKDISVIFNL